MSSPRPSAQQRTEARRVLRAMGITTDEQAAPLEGKLHAAGLPAVPEVAFIESLSIED